MLARASTVTKEQLTAEDVVRQIELKFCIDAEVLNTNIGLGFVEARSYEDLTDEQVRTFLEDGCGQSKEWFSINQLDKIVATELRTNMRNINATARMEDVFTSYYALLNLHRVLCLITSNPKVAVNHVFYAIKPQLPHTRFTRDLYFLKYDLGKDFSGFIKHAVKLADPFEWLDICQALRETACTELCSLNNRRGVPRTQT